MSLNYDLVLRQQATKFIKKQDKKTQLRILKALEGLQKVPPEGDVKKLRGEQQIFRLRIGTYRALFSVNHNQRRVIVDIIGNRGDIYR